MPLGTIDTGCLDLESNGTFGFSYDLQHPHAAARRIGRADAGAGLVCGRQDLGAVSRGSNGDGIAVVAARGGVAAGRPGSGAARVGSQRDGRSRVGQERAASACATFPRAACSATTRPCCAGPVRCAARSRSGVACGSAETSVACRSGSCVATAGGSQTASSRGARRPPHRSRTPRAAAGRRRCNVAVEPGDRIELVLERAEVCEDFVGVDFSIVDTAVGKTWDVAADWSDTQNPNGPWTYDDARRRQFDLFQRGALPSIARADEIHYWGHYPIVDIEYQTTAPVQVGLARVEFLRARGIGRVADSGRRIRNAPAEHDRPSRRRVRSSSTSPAGRPRRPVQIASNASRSAAS